MNYTQDQHQTSLKIKREELISKFLHGMNQDDFMDLNTLMLDEYFCNCFEKSIIGPSIGINKNPYAIIALGGYGRKEQCVYSDIDLLFIFHKRLPKETNMLIQEMIYPLWDIGLEVGYATRSMKECISLAKSDIEVFTSLLDARFICGMSYLYTDLMNMLRAKIVSKQSKKFINALYERHQNRHEIFGDSTYLLEPNLKEGQGGLRDYHMIIWIAKIMSDLTQPRDLEYDGYLSYNEFNSLRNALSFIWKVRNHLHILTNRKCDQLRFENQIKISNILQFKKYNGELPVERFLGDLHKHMEFIKQRSLIFLTELGYPKKINLREKLFTKSTKIEGLKVNKDMLFFDSLEALLENPSLLIKIFEESSKLKIPLSAEAQRIIKEFNYLVDDNFRCKFENVKSFESILKASNITFNALDEMLNTGFLYYLIPEFKKIINKIQYDEYHIYPVDKHSLYSVKTIKQFINFNEVDPLCFNIYKKLSNRKLLLWAALLHDIGKGESDGNHSEIGAKMAQIILSRMGYKTKQIETVVFLVKEHLFLIKIATRRDINVEETAIFCAKHIGSIEKLNMLYLLTIADSIATGPKAFNEWTATLLRDLTLKIFKILKKGELASKEALNIIESKKQNLLTATATATATANEKEKQEAQKFIDIMSPRYLLYIDSKDMVEHINLYKQISDEDFVWKIEKDQQSNTRVVTICAKDCPGLFSKIAGVFTLNNLDILEAQIYTWKNNTALDIFKVKPPLDKIFEDEKWSRTKDSLKAALLGKLDLSAMLQKKKPINNVNPHVQGTPNKINIDNETSSFFTIIEIFAYDFPGLLFKITNVLFELGLDVWVAKISTKVDQIADVFYVRDLNGEKVDSTEQTRQIKETLEQIIL